jgi:hypothetical protein
VATVGMVALSGTVPFRNLERAKSPKTGSGVACEQSPQSWPRWDISGRPGSPTTPAASATCSRPEGIGDGNFGEHMVPAYGAGMALGRGDFRRVIAKAVRLISISRYSFLHSRSQKLATASRVDMRHCTSPTTSRML